MDRARLEVYAKETVCILFLLHQVNLHRNRCKFSNGKRLQSLCLATAVLHAEFFDNLNIFFYRFRLYIGFSPYILSRFWGPGAKKFFRLWSVTVELVAALCS